MGNLSVNNGGIATNKGGMPSIDLRYGPYESVAAAYAQLGPDGDDVITPGLTVGIISGSTVTEYWFQGGTALANLVPKQSVTYSDGDLVIGGIRYQLLQQKAAEPVLEVIGDTVSASVADGSTIRYTKTYYDASEGRYPEVVIPSADTGSVYSDGVVVLPGEKFILCARSFKEGCIPSDPVSFTCEYDDSRPLNQEGIGDNGSIEF